MTEDKANELEIGSRIALYGEDNHLYGVLELEESILKTKRKKRNLYTVRQMEHPGVAKVYEKAAYI